MPLPGDPCLFTYWMKFFDNVWGGEINHLYVYHNSPAEKSVADYIHTFSSDRVTILYEPQFVDHGDCIYKTLEHVKEDLVMLVEDDAYIFKPTKVDRCFRDIENGHVDVVAGHRASCHDEIVDVAHKKWGAGDQPNFWPCYLFISKENLIKAGPNYCAKAWRKGETIESLDHVVENDLIASDTFVEASLKIRNMGLRIWLEDQYHGMTDDEPDYKHRLNIWHPDCHWMHCGSLSSGFNGVLATAEGIPLAQRFTGKPQAFPNYCNTNQEMLEFERRICFWWLAYEETRANPRSLEINEFLDEYRGAIDRLIKNYRLGRKRILQRMSWYREAGL